MVVSKVKTVVFAFAGVIAFASYSHAATVSITTYDGASYPSVPNFNVLASQDFESSSIGDGVSGPSIDSSDSFNVGVFKSIGGTGSGGTVTAAPDECQGTGADNLCLRNEYVYGRTNVFPSGGTGFLDSNDTHGINWVVGLGGASFDTISFTLMDAADVGAYVGITGSPNALGDNPTANEVFDLAGLALMTPYHENENIKTVVISFDQLVTEAFVNIVSFAESDGSLYLTNDGLGIDGVRVGISGVPLPATGLLLLGAFGSFAIARRKSKKAQSI